MQCAWEEIILKILEVSKDLDGKSKEQKLLKLIEEVGELSQAFLVESNASGTLHRDKTDFSVVEELSDCFICLVSLVQVLNINLDQFQETIEYKIQKWKNKLLKERGDNKK